MSSNEKITTSLLFFNNYFHRIVLISLLLFDLCNCEWTSGGITTTFPHHDESGVSFITAYINVTYRDPINNRLLSEKSETGKFGAAHIYPARGVLIHISSTRGDHTGCSLPFKSSFNSFGGTDHLPNEPWIALVKRGGCNFQVKIDNAYRSNASGIIVYNDRDKQDLEKMKISPVDVNSNMSAVFTYKWKGEELAHLVDNGTRVYAHITIASHCTRPFNTINRTSVLFVSISFIVLMIISLAWLVFYYIQRFRYIHAKDRLSRRLCSAAKKALSKIPTKHIKAEDKEIQGEGECCAICIEPYKTSEIVRILPCKHEFHRSCIDPWLLEHRTCPMCKMDILKHYGFVFTGSQESILHMDIEEAVSDTDSVHHPSLSPVPHGHHVQSGNIGMARSLTPDLLSHSSRASTPDEYSPALPQPSASLPHSAVSPIQGNLNLMMSPSHYITGKINPQIRRSVSLDNCELPSTSQ